MSEIRAVPVDRLGVDENEAVDPTALSSLQDAIEAGEEPRPKVTKVCEMRAGSWTYEPCALQDTQLIHAYDKLGWSWVEVEVVDAPA